MSLSFIAKDTKPPTSGAISQHVAALRKKNGGGKAPTNTLSALPISATSTPRKAPVTARTSTPKTPKTPATGEKRKRVNATESEMSDDNDSEPELSKAKMTNVGRRNSTPRRGKIIKQTYKEDSSEDDEDEDDQAKEQVVDNASDEEDVRITVDNDGNGNEQSFNFDSTGDTETNHLANGSAKKGKKFDLYGDDDDDDGRSDIS